MWNDLMTQMGRSKPVNDDELEEDSDDEVSEGNNANSEQDTNATTPKIQSNQSVQQQQPQIQQQRPVKRPTPKIFKKSLMNNSLSNSQVFKKPQSPGIFKQPPKLQAQQVQGGQKLGIRPKKTVKEGLDKSREFQKTNGIFNPKKMITNMQDPLNQTQMGGFQKKSISSQNNGFVNYDNFYNENNDKLDSQRPQTNQTLRNNRNTLLDSVSSNSSRVLEQIQNNDKTLWFKQSKNLPQNLEEAFSINIPFSQNQKNQQEFSIMIDSWILEMKKIDKILDVQAAQTETLVQEAQIWEESIIIYEKFEKEASSAYVLQAIKIFKEKAQFDQDLKKKLSHYNNLLVSIRKNKKETKQFALKVKESCLQNFQLLTTAYYTQYPNIYYPTLEKILDLYVEFTQIFNQRIYYVLEKIYKILIKKMKQCYINFNLSSDLENTDFVSNLISGFEGYIVQLIEIWEEVCDTKQSKDSTNKIHENMFMKKLQQLRFVLRDINKLRSIFDKLDKQRVQYSKSKNQTNLKQEIQQKIEIVINKHKNTKITFDIFDYSCKQKWEVIINGFRSNIQEIKDLMKQIQQQQTKEDKEEEQQPEQQQQQQEDQQPQQTQASFFNPLFNTMVNWKIS